MMPDSSSLTLRVSTEIKAKLERLAGHTHRTRNFLAGQALDDYLDRELAIVEAIERGRDEIRSGHGLTTEDVFRGVEAAIAEVEAVQAKR